MIDATVLLTRRTLCGLSQRTLAKRAGVNAMTIKRIEDGADASELPLSVLGHLADALEVEPGELLRRRHRSSSSHRTPATESVLDARPLDHNAARLLRRIHRGGDIRRGMSKVDREIILPALVNRGLVAMTSGGAVLTHAVRASLSATPQLDQVP